MFTSSLVIRHVCIILESIAADSYFSAVCWVYGRILNKRLGYPIGLVESDVGGTLVECWSSAAALKKCKHHNESEEEMDKYEYNRVTRITLLAENYLNAVHYKLNQVYFHLDTLNIVQT